MKILFVGDVHATPGDLADCEVLIDQVRTVAEQNLVDKVVFLGDLHHNMALVRVEVTEFWMKAFESLKKKVICIVGNHDMPGDASQTGHALLSYRNIPNVTVVDTPEPFLVNGLLFLPYYHSKEEFVKACNDFEDTKTVICHQEFMAARAGTYESKHGVSSNDIPQSQVIAGHYHETQENGKTWYPGNPRWLTATDANQEKNLWVVDFNELGEITSRQAIPSECRQIRSIVDREEALYTKKLEANHKYHVEIMGSAAFIEGRRSYWMGKAKIKTTRTDSAPSKVTESDGINLALSKYLSNSVPKMGTPKSVLERMIYERVKA